MDALALMVEVSQNPTVRAFDYSLSLYRTRMVAMYGEAFMDEPTEDKNGFPTSHEGVNRWTPAQRYKFMRLDESARAFRAALRVSLAR
jgi:hypothetical protein